MPVMHYSWKDASRSNWGADRDTSSMHLPFTPQEVGVGALCRIATALERIQSLLDPDDREIRRAAKKAEEEEAIAYQEWTAARDSQLARLHMLADEAGIQKSDRYSLKYGLPHVTHYRAGPGLATLRMQWRAELDETAKLTLVDIIERGIENSGKAPKRLATLRRIREQLPRSGEAAT